MRVWPTTIFSPIQFFRRRRSRIFLLRLRRWLIGQGSRPETSGKNKILAESYATSTNEELEKNIFYSKCCIVHLLKKSYLEWQQLPKCTTVHTSRHTESFFTLEYTREYFVFVWFRYVEERAFVVRNAGGYFFVSQYTEGKGGKGWMRQ